MKISSTVTKVAVIEPNLAWLSSGHLEVSCGTSFSFRVDNTAAARKTYVVGRSVEVSITPRKP